MKKTLTTLLSATAFLLTLSTVETMAGTKKNDPDKKEVLKELKETIGGEHYVDKMKVNSMGYLKFEAPDGEDDFYHIYNASLREGGYRIVIYNNKPEYLGYYATEFEGSELEQGAILLDSGESDEDGNTDYITLPIPDKGPASKVRIDGVQVSFVKNPQLEADKTAVAASGGIPVVQKETSADGEVIDYRDWTITMKGKQSIFNAKFEKVEGGKVFIKSSKNGKVASVPGSVLSDEDKAYVTRITSK